MLSHIIKDTPYIHNQNYFMKQLLLILIISATASCTTQLPAADVQEVIQADKDFSALSQQQGMKKAFLSYMDSNAVMLSANHMPVVGNDLAKHYSEQNYTNIILTW